MTKIPCCVPGCFDRESKRHRFPKDRDFMQKWIKSVNNRAVEDAEPEQIYNRYYVCQRHFADKHIVPGTKRGLSAVAVPMLFLPRSSEETTNIGKSAISFVENVLEGMSLSTAIKEVEKNKEVTLTNTELIETLTDDSPVFSSIDIKEVVNPSEVTLELPVALEDSVTSSKLEETVPRDEVAEDKPVLPPKSEKSYCDDEVKNLLGKCRLCLLNPGLYIIAQEEHLSQQIVDYIQIELVETPNYPQLICRCCKTIMDTIHSFFTKAHKANLTLKNALTNTTNKVEHTFKTEDTPETFNETTDCQPLAEVTQDLNKQCKEEADIPPIERRFKCEFCHQSFVLVSQYRRHKKLHRVFYVCNKAGCGRTFSEEQNFKRHLQYHNQRNTNYKLALKHKKYTCRICKKYFVSLKLLTQHRESHTNIECPVDECKIILKNWKTFDTHMMTHTERKTYLCQVCGKTFSTRIGLASHEKVHRGVRYNCDVCEASYTSKKTLSEHMQVKHEGVRFYCSMCPNSYATKVSLRFHEKAHTGQRDYHCTFCPKSFLAKKNLVYHMLIHQGLRPFQCQVCFKSYSAKSTLQCHERIHTGQKYICTVEGCKKLLTRIDRLRNHIKTKHPEHCNVDNNT